MSIREEMQSLAQEISGSHEARTEGIASLRKTTQDQLRELDSAHQTMARELRADLGKVKPALSESEAQRKPQVNAWMKEVAEEVATERKTTQDQLKEYRDEQAGARAAWQELTTTMQPKRGGGTALAEAPEPAPIEKATGVPGPGATEEMAPQILDLGGRVFDYLANCPGGVKLAKMEQEFGLSRIKMARAVRTLMDEGRVEKRDLLYFTV